MPVSISWVFRESCAIYHNSSDEARTEVIVLGQILSQRIFVDRISIGLDNSVRSRVLQLTVLAVTAFVHHDV